MNHEQLLLAAAVGASLILGAPSVQADYLTPSVEARLQAAADHGPNELRQFVWRTRMIYALRLEDVSGRLGTAVDEAEWLATADEGEVGEPAGDRAAAPSPDGDAFRREFFRNDARD